MRPIISASLSFAGLRSTHPRTEPCRGVVVHWTGGAGGPEQVYRTLRARKGPRSPDGLSIHFVVSAQGEVVQMAPLSMVCLHAGAANEWSVGIEVVSPGIAKGSAYERERKAGIRREVYEDRVRNRARVRMVDFTEAQTESVTLLVEWLCDVIKIPRRVPLEADGSLVRRQMTPGEEAAFSGVLGHYHVHSTKLDPGTRFLDALRVRWA